MAETMTDRIAIRTQDDLIEAFRAVKDRLGLSNTWCDEVGGFTRGQTDKVLGPTRAKGLSPMLLQTYCSLFAVKLEMVVDLEQAKVMEARWDGRDTSQVRMDTGRISKKLVERAKPVVMKHLAAAGGKASGAMRTGSQGSEIMRKVAKSRWRKVRLSTETRNERERLRLAAKRRDPAYIAAERERNRERMKKRRKLPEYKALERANGYWQHP